MIPALATRTSTGPEGLLDGGEGRVDLGGIGDVAGDGQKRQSARFGTAPDRRARRCVGDRHPVSEGLEPPGAGQPDAARPAGDQDHPAVRARLVVCS